MGHAAPGIFTSEHLFLQTCSTAGFSKDCDPGQTVWRVIRAHKVGDNCARSHEIVELLFELALVDAIRCIRRVGAWTVHKKSKIVIQERIW